MGHEIVATCLLSATHVLPENTHCITIDLPNQGRRKSACRFDGGRMSSDGGTLLLQACGPSTGTSA